MNRLPRLVLAAALACLIVGGLSLAQPGGTPGYATIVIKLPESATLKIGDYTSKQKGPLRTLYIPPPFEPGYTYFYMIEATWTEGGKPQKAIRKVQVQPNQSIQVEFVKGEVIPAPKKLETIEPKKIETIVPKKVPDVKKDEPKKADVKKDEPKKSDSKKDDAKKADAKKDEPKKSDSKKDDAKKADAKKDEPKKSDSKKGDAKKADAPKDNSKEAKKDDPNVVRKKLDDKKAEPKKAEPKKDEPKKDDTGVLGGGRTFLFTYAGEVTGVKPGQEVSVWLPVPSTTVEQQVGVVAKKLPADGTFASDKQYGNMALFFKAKASQDGKVPYEIVYHVTRKAVKSDGKAHLTLKPRATETVSRFLEPDKLVPIDGKPLELLKNTKLPSNDPVATAKVLYDLVNGYMKYSKEGKGWGNGDAVWACQSKFGNCTDFHSLFISLARAQKIPSKFEMGFSVPAKRGAGTVGGYHCWAWFMPDASGWVPVDISEANRFPAMRDYYFGSLTEDRVQFSTGRDITLEPKQQGAALNYFIYPYAEVAGQAYPQDKISCVFSYQDVNP